MSVIQFTTLIRLPFIRGDFVDPPQADWNAAKDRALWKVISKSSKTSDLNWVELASKFQVSPTFILQQAAWLYERHLDHVRAQMKKVGGATSSGAVGTSSANVGPASVPMHRVGSGGSGRSTSVAIRTTSSLATRSKDRPLPRVETGVTSPSLSRTPSTNTITQSRINAPPPSTRNPLQPASRGSVTGPRPPNQQQGDHATSPQQLSMELDSPEAGSSSQSSSSGSDSEGPSTQSQLFRRPPRFKSHRTRSLLTYEENPDGEGEDSVPASNTSLPFASVTQNSIQRKDKSQASTLKKHDPAAGGKSQSSENEQSSESKRADAPSIKHSRVPSENVGDVSSSIASSTSDAPKSLLSHGPLSPKHRAELARLSPRRSGTKGKTGSDGTPSMGSSFSDIDDTSITQSALEEALLSNMQHGRMSTLSQLRSRYL